MRFKRNIPIFVFILGLFAIGFAQSVAAQTYAGEGAAVKLVLDTTLTNPITSAISATGPLPADGGNINLSSLGTSVGGTAVTVGDSTVSTSGGVLGGDVNTSQSSASVNSLNVSVLGIGITADAVASSTNCSCGGAVCSGSSVITNLVVGGTSITVTGAVNQTETVVVAGIASIQVIINQQIVSPGAITVNALHITVTALNSTAVADVIVSQAHSGITCTVIPLSSLYSGRAYGIWLRDSLILNSGVSVIVADTGFLPTSGGNISVSTVGASFPPLLGNATVTSNTAGGSPVGTSNSSSQVENLDINIPLGLPGIPALRIRADVLQSQTQCSCSATTPTCTGSSTLLGLRANVGILNVPITIDGSPNQHLVIDVLGLGLVNLVLDINNQRTVGAGSITQEALRIGVSVPAVTNLLVVIASSHSDIVCGLGPSAANISVSGQVFDQQGNFVRNAVVTITGPSGSPRSTRTNAFGNYRFEDLEQNEFYVLDAKNKLYQFQSQAISSTEDVTGLSIFALPENNRGRQR